MTQCVRGDQRSQGSLWRRAAGQREMGEQSGLCSRGDPGPSADLSGQQGLPHTPGSLWVRQGRFAYFTLSMASVLAQLWYHEVPGTCQVLVSCLKPGQTGRIGPATHLRYPQHPGLPRQDMDSDGACFLSVNPKLLVLSAPSSHACTGEMNNLRGKAEPLSFWQSHLVSMYFPRRCPCLSDLTFVVLE